MRTVRVGRKPRRPQLPRSNAAYRQDEFAGTSGSDLPATLLVKNRASRQFAGLHRLGRFRRRYRPGKGWRGFVPPGCGTSRIHPAVLLLLLAHPFRVAMINDRPRMAARSRMHGPVVKAGPRLPWDASL